MTKKGQMPAHIQPKTFCHPQPGLRLIQVLEKIPDPSLSLQKKRGKQPFFPREIENKFVLPC